MVDRVRLYLVRHGHVQYFDEQSRPINPKYAPLSAEGRAQIQLLSEQLAAEIQFDQAYSSTMPRSIETANLLLQSQQQKNLISLDDLREIKAGRLKEITTQDAKTHISYAYQQQTFGLKQFLNGETWIDFQNRIIPCIQNIVQQHLGQDILISSHDAVNRLLIAWAYDQLQHDLNVQEQHYGALNIIDIFIENELIIEKRVLLQNYTPYNLFKRHLTTNAVEDVYQMYLKTNGFQEKTP